MKEEDLKKIEKLEEIAKKIKETLPTTTSLNHINILQEYLSIIEKKIYDLKNNITRTTDTLEDVLRRYPCSSSLELFQKLKKWVDKI